MPSDAGLIWRQPRKPKVQVQGAFLPLMRTAVRARPEDRNLLLDLIMVLSKEGQWREIVDRLASPMAGGLAPELAVELGVAATHCGDLSLARRALENAIDGRADEALRDPGGHIVARQRACAELSSLLAASGEDEAALRLVTDALDRNPRDEAALSMTVDLMLKRGDPTAVIVLLDDLERQGVRSTLQLSCRANALGALGAHRELEEFVSPARWCSETLIGGDLVDNRRLAEIILTHPELQTSPRDRPTLGYNQRLVAVASRGEPECRAVVSAIREHVDAYVASRRDQLHPVMALMPETAVLQGWALATSGNGHEPRHIHPKSWITAVYYLRVPAMKRNGTQPPPGSIVFGPWPGEIYPRAARLPGWHIEPREGMLLIFPSFLAHSTIPSGTDELRLTVTLDVMRAGAPDA